MAVLCTGDPLEVGEGGGFTCSVCAWHGLLPEPHAFQALPIDFAALEERNFDAPVDVLSRVRSKFTASELAAHEEAAREHLRCASIPDSDVDDFVIAITMLGDIAKGKVLAYAMKKLHEQQNNWPDTVEERR